MGNRYEFQLKQGHAPEPVSAKFLDKIAKIRLNEFNDFMWRLHDTNYEFFADSPLDYYAQSPFYIVNKKEPENYLIKPFITERTIIVIAGEPASGKSWMGLDLSMSLSMGKSWLGYETSQGAVLYLDQESGKFADRFKMSLKSHDVNNSLNMPLIIVPPIGIDLFDDQNKWDEMIEEMIIKYKFKLVVIDSLSAVIGEADENSSGHMTIIFSKLRRIVNRTACCFIILHHLNRQGSSRGSGAIRAACDIHAVLSQKKGVIKIKTDKNRHGLPWEITARMSFENDGLMLTSIKDKSTINQTDTSGHTKGELKIIEYLQSKGQSTYKELCEFGKNNVTLLKNKGLIETCGKIGKNTFYKIKEINPEVSCPEVS